QVSFFFFFQAEDGIRDDLVTGVQTCALPIFDANGNPIPVAAASRTPFPGNMIPASRITSLSQKILGLVPGTNVLNPGTGPNYQEIGRASCRERVSIEGDDGTVTNNT